MGIWDQLNTRTLFGSNKATATQVNTQEKDIHIEENNRALLADVNLINKALMRDGGPIPGTLVIRQIVSDDSGVKFNLDFVEAGEVWLLYGFSVAAMTSRSGSCAHEVYVADRNTSLVCEIIDAAASSSQFPMLENNWMGPMYIDVNAYLAYEVTGDYSDSTLQFISVRVR